MMTTDLCSCPPTGLVSLERTRFFPRQLVAPDDLTQDQIYFRDKLRRHNRFLHGWGIVCGARVRTGPGPCDAIVEPGYLLGPWGDEILIDREVTVDLCREGAGGECGTALDPWCSDVRVERGSGKEFYLAVRYAECQARPVRATGTACGCEEIGCEYSRIRDSFALKLLTELPESYKLPLAPAAPPAPAVTGGAGEEKEQCADFWTPGVGANPLTEDGVVFEVLNVAHQGVTRPPNTEVKSAVSQGDTFIGLDVMTDTEITLPVAATFVRLDILHQASEVRAQAFGEDGGMEDQGALANVAPQPEKINLNGTAIRKVRIQGDKRTLLLAVCYKAAAPAQPGPEPAPATHACAPCPAEPWVILAVATFKGDGTLDQLDCTRYRRYVRTLAGSEYYGGAAGAAGGGAAHAVIAGRAPTRETLRQVLDTSALRRLEAGGRPTRNAVVGLPATALKDVGARSAFGRALGRRTVAEVAAMERDVFVAEMRRAVTTAAPEEVEARARDVWTRARTIG
jgi:hypothetical protein